MNDVLQGILLLMGLLGVLSLFLSIFLVVNTVSALLTQQKRQIGVMKAVGGGMLQILGMYLVMVFSYGAMALMIAIPFGMYGARKLSSVLAVFFNFDLYSMDVPPQTYLIQAAVGLILPVLASLVPFLSNLRISAAEAMSSYTMGPSCRGTQPPAMHSDRALHWTGRRLPRQFGRIPAPGPRPDRVSQG